MKILSRFTLGFFPGFFQNFSTVFLLEFLSSSLPTKRNWIHPRHFSEISSRISLVFFLGFCNNCYRNASRNVFRHSSNPARIGLWVPSGFSPGTCASRKFLPGFFWNFTRIPAQISSETYLMLITAGYSRFLNCGLLKLPYTDTSQWELLQYCTLRILNGNVLFLSVWIFPFLFSTIHFFEKLSGWQDSIRLLINKFSFAIF